MRRRPAILFLLALALVIPACGGGDDDAGGTTTGPGESSTTVDQRAATTDAIWYTDWDAGAVGRWDLAAAACSGVTPVGLSADSIEVGLGWAWVTDCLGGQLVRLDVQTGEVTGRLDLGACPSGMALAFGWVWLALPSEGKVVAVDPETGTIVAEGTSDLDTVTQLAAGSLHATGSNYYWKVDEVSPPAPGAEPWQFRFEDVATTQAQFNGTVQGLAVVTTGAGQVAVLIGPPPGSDRPDYDDPGYPTSLFTVGDDGTTQQVGDPLMGFYNYLGVFDGHYVATSKATDTLLILNGGANAVPLGGPAGLPMQGPPPPGESGFGPGVWVGYGDPQAPGLVFFDPANPPVSFDAPAVPLACQGDDTLLGIGSYALLSAADIAMQAGLADAMVRTAFPMGPFPTDSIIDTGPQGPRFSSCSVGYQGADHLLNGMEGTTDAGTTVALSIEVGTLLYADLATAVAGDDGSFTLPDFDLDDLTTPIPAGATITVVLTGDGNDLGACRLEVET